MRGWEIEAVRTDFQTAFPTPGDPHAKFLSKREMALNIQITSSSANLLLRRIAQEVYHNAHVPTDCPSFPGCTASAGFRLEDQFRHQDESVLAKKMMKRTGRFVNELVVVLCLVLVAVRERLGILEAARRERVRDLCV